MADSLKQKRKSLSLKEKSEIIRLLESGKPQTEVAKMKGLKRQTVTQIWKKRNEIQANFLKHSSEAKKCRSSEFEKIDAALLKWFRAQVNQRISMNGPLLLEKARDFARLLSISNFKASNGWLDKWKRRHGIILKVTSGEAAAVNQEMVSNWLKEMATWSAIFSQYSPSDIYSCDETGLFWRLMPDESVDFKDETCSDGKLSKERITVLLCCNMDGSDKLKLLVIGRSLKPRAFKRLHSTDNLPVEYKANKNAWMTVTVFSEWLNTLNKRMISQNKTIVLLLNNCPSHPNIHLTNVHLVFLSPYATSVCQPLDKGIIQNFKLRYRGMLLRKIIGYLESNKSSKIDLLDAMLMLNQSWDQVSASCITNCFSKAGFAHSVDTDESHLSEELPVNLYLEAAHIDNSSENLTTDYISIDEKLATNHNSTEEEIVSSVLEVQSEVVLEESDEEVCIEEDMTSTSSTECLQALETVKGWLLHQHVARHSEMNAILDIEDLVYRQMVSKKANACD